MADLQIFVISEEKDNVRARDLQADLIKRGAIVTANRFDLYPHDIIQNYDWLVLIRPGDTCPPYIQSIVNAALGAVSSLKADNARLTNILALDTGKSDPDAWPTIRTYDAHSKEEYARSLDRMWKTLSASKQAVPPAQPAANVDTRGAQGVQNVDFTPVPRKASAPPVQRAATVSPALPPSQPNQRPKSALLAMITTIVVILVIIASLVLVYIKLPRPLTNLQVGETATATIRNDDKTAIARETANPVITPTPTPSPHDLYTSITKKKPDIDDLLTVTTPNHTIQWDSTGPCQFITSGYQVTNSQSGSFTACMGHNQKFKNFAVQVTMSIQGGYAGGLIFRSDEQEQNYYRFSVAQQGQYNLSVCNKTHPCTGTTNTGGKSLIFDSVTLPQQNTSSITLTVIVIGDAFYLYVDGKNIPAGSNAASVIDDSIAQAGEIGLYAASSNTEQTTVIFNSLKVWKLP